MRISRKKPFFKLEINGCRKFFAELPKKVAEIFCRIAENGNSATKIVLPISATANRQQIMRCRNRQRQIQQNFGNFGNFGNRQIVAAQPWHTEALPKARKGVQARNQKRGKKAEHCCFALKITVPGLQFCSSALFSPFLVPRLNPFPRFWQGLYALSSRGNEHRLVIVRETCDLLAPLVNCAAIRIQNFFYRHSRFLILNTSENDFLKKISLRAINCLE